MLVLLGMLANVEVLQGMHQTTFKRSLLVSIIGRSLVFRIALDPLCAKGTNGYLFEFHPQRSHLYTQIKTLLALKSNGSIKNISGLFFIGDDLIDLL